jgi:germacradienol/geosmin synthase
MQPFELPDFYTPWPARLSSNLEAARVHSKAWAYKMGILGSDKEAENSGVWDERTFDAHDYALLCAYIHPDAPEEELNLITDWYVWIFFFDDHFLETYKRSQDMFGAKAYLDRLPAFMPIDSSEILPVPSNPVERGLANLWSITAFTKSKQWRQRFFDNTKNQFDASLCELANINQNRIPNPIEFIEMRRVVGGALWSSDLIEHASSIEIPDEITNTRQIRVLKDSFADAVHLRNDIFSYQREVEDEGENSNCVLVFERFFNFDTQKAANVTNDLLTSRLQQFEHTVITELPLLVEKDIITPKVYIDILLFIKGLQDFQSGAHDWHMRSSRYMNKKANTASTSIPILGIPMGLGISTVNILSLYNTFGLNRFKNYTHVHYQSVGSVTLPSFYMPFSTKLNPYFEVAQKHSKYWADKMGILTSIPSRPDVFVWDERKFDAGNWALYSALICPNISVDQLKVIACWVTWGTYIDDYFPRLYAGNRCDLIGAKVFVARLSEFMPIDLTTSIPIPTNPVECGLSDLWQCSAKDMATDTLYLFRCTIEDFIGSMLWELANHAQNKIPDPIDYVEMRRKTFGWDLIKMFTQKIEKRENTQLEIYCTRTMQEISNAAIDYMWLTNDIISYQKEMEFEGELHNSILVAQCFLSCNQTEAVKILCNMMTARMRQFEYLVTTDLPILFKNFDLDTKSRKGLLSYIEKLQHLMCGNLQWHLTTNRYKEFELKNEQARSRKSTPTPTGLGMSATQITALLKTKKTKDTVSSIDPTLNEVNATGLGTSAARVIDLLKELK